MAEKILAKFLERVIKNRKLWGLYSEEMGWAFCASVEDENRDVIVFWSTRAGAVRHAKEEWSDFAPASIDLEEFVSAWLKQMKRKGIRAGLEWDENLVGLEVKAKDLEAVLT